MSAKTALMNYYKKQAKKESRPKRAKNKRPEKEVEKLVTAWLEKHLFDFNVVESKAVYSQSAGRYLSGQTDAGFSDIVGNSDDGLPVFIELKAPGKRHSLRPEQFQFLKAKIEKKCFAVCIDSVESLESVWFEWLSRRQESIAQAQIWLMAKLPVPKRFREKDLSEPLF